jgi:hypothetical protein
VGKAFPCPSAGDALAGQRGLSLTPVRKAHGVALGCEAGYLFRDIVTDSPGVTTATRRWRKRQGLPNRSTRTLARAGELRRETVEGCGPTPVDPPAAS